MTTTAYTNVKIKTFRNIGPEPNKYFERVISINIVPCIKVQGWWPEEAPHSLQNVDRNVVGYLSDEFDCSLIFAPPNSVHRMKRHSEKFAKVSFADAESHLIKVSPPVVRAAFMICKWLVSDPPKSSFVPSSHVLKTAVLLCLAEMNKIPKPGAIWNEDYEYLDDEEITQWVRQILHRLLNFARQDFVPTFLMPSFRLSVWHCEQFLYSANSSIRRYGIDFDEIVKRNYWSRANHLLQVTCAVAFNHLLYWSVLEEGSSTRVEYPILSTL